MKWSVLPKSSIYLMSPQYKWYYKATVLITLSCCGVGGQLLVKTSPPQAELQCTTREPDPLIQNRFIHPEPWGGLSSRGPVCWEEKLLLLQIRKGIATSLGRLSQVSDSQWFKHFNKGRITYFLSTKVLQKIVPESWAKIDTPLLQ